MHLIRRHAALAALVVICSASLVGCKSKNQPVATVHTSPSSVGSYHGVTDSSIRARPEFLLTDTFGHAYDFKARTAGKPTLLYFGYTHCPDECPTAMHDVHAALRLVPASVRDKFVVVFVTTDPKRDTPTVLSHWLQTFDSTFVGLTGSAAQISAAENAVPVPLAAEDSSAPLPSGGYSVSHAAVLVAYDTADRSPVLFPSGTSVDDMAADFSLLAKEPS